MQRAFSLVELSIVLVILGLLTGGILAGQSLIRAAELRSVSTEMNRYSTAIYTFRDKYFALPGDMNNAFAFWGATAGCTNVTVNVDTAGCNGNGDGNVASGNDGESARAWQHMALAGLIEGTYSGIWLTEPYQPKSKLNQAQWQMKSWQGPAVHHWVGAPTTYTLMLALGSASTIKPAEAWNLDTKFDDGRASNGKVFPHATSPAGCVTGTNWGATASEYALTDTSATCIMIMMLQ